MMSIDMPCLCVALQEQPWIGEQALVGPSWPAEGSVEFQGLALRYRDGLDLVLKGIDVKIKGGEKVGAELTNECINATAFSYHTC